MIETTLIKTKCSWLARFGSGSIKSISLPFFHLCYVYCHSLFKLDLYASNENFNVFHFVDLSAEPAFWRPFWFRACFFWSISFYLAAKWFQFDMVLANRMDCWYLTLIQGLGIWPSFTIITLLSNQLLFAHQDLLLQICLHVLRILTCDVFPSMYVLSASGLSPFLIVIFWYFDISTQGITTPWPYPLVLVILNIYHIPHRLIPQESSLFQPALVAMLITTISCYLQLSTIV